MDKRPDSGVLFPAKVKKHEKAPDFSGDLTIDLSNLTNVVRDGDLLTVKVNGWKKKSRTGDSYLSMAVNRWVPNKDAQPKKDDFEDEVPF